MQKMLEAKIPLSLRIINSVMQTSEKSPYVQVTDRLSFQVIENNVKFFEVDTKMSAGINFSYAAQKLYINCI